MSKPSTNEHAPARTSASGRGLSVLEADLEVIGSPWALWARLLIAAILVCVFGGLGLLALLTGLVGVAAHPPGQLGTAIGVLATGVGVCAASIICLKAGFATYSAYRARGLL